MVSNDIKELLFRYVKNLNIHVGTNALNAKNRVGSATEEQKNDDDKGISLGMPKQPQEEDGEE
jgi:hypothetical protein